MSVQVPFLLIAVPLVLLMHGKQQTDLVFIVNNSNTNIDCNIIFQTVGKMWIIIFMF